MVKLTFKHGLLYTYITLFHQGKEVIVKDVIVDTGASHSIISKYLKSHIPNLRDMTFMRAYRICYIYLGNTIFTVYVYSLWK
jgi:hypoxanthine phosphoribosyltransferase